MSFSSLSDDLINTFSDLEQKSLNGDSSLRLTGLIDLDLIMRGLRPSELIILASRPSHGKSSLALHIAQNIASSNQRSPTLIFSLEMSKAELLFRFLSKTSSLPIYQLREGNMQEESWEQLSQGIHALSHLPIFIEDNPKITIQELCTQVHDFYDERGQLGLVVIDYVQLLRSDRPNANRAEELVEIVQQLKILARELDVPVLALSQVSRNVEARHNQRPTLCDLQGSSSLEEAADVVILLFREDLAYSDSLTKGMIEINVAKHRNGETGTVKVVYVPRNMKLITLASPAKLG